MNNLPDRTNICKPMPKELFYKYLNSSGTLKKTFMDEIESITWTNTLSPETMTIRPGKYVTEIALVEIVSKRQAVTQNLLDMIARETDPYTIFIVRYEEWGQIWCCDQWAGDHQEEQFKCENYYQTSWFPYDELVLKLVGLDLDQVYAHIFYQIAGKRLAIKKEPQRVETPEKTAQQTEAEQQAQVKKMEANIKQLETEIDREKQFGRQVRLSGDLKKAREELKRIKTHGTQMEVHQPEPIEPPQNTIESVRSYFPNVFRDMKNGTGNRVEYYLF